MIQRPYMTVIIDDDKNVQEVVEVNLETDFDGILKIKSFEDAKKGLEFVQNSHNKVRIVITDIHMGKVFGDNVMRECLKADPSILVVPMSGDLSFTTISNLFLDGAEYYLSKPFNKDDLTGVIKKCIEKLDHWRAFLAPRGHS
jgi:DNA-binding NtrC family response regulator